MATSEDRFQGCLLGLAVGDAVGTSVEFQPRGTFEPVTDMVGGGPFDLKPGQWTDDTSMALCLAESLVERRCFDAADQMRRYVRWWREGHLSSTGECFDIGTTTRGSLERFERTGEPLSGPTDPDMAGNGSLMRLAPVVMFFADEPQRAIAMAGESSRTTHGATACVDACRYFAVLLSRALSGASKQDLLAGDAFWHRDLGELVPEIAEIAAGSFKHKEPPAIQGSGYVVRCLEAALWAFHRTDNFRDGCLLAVNLGDDADTTAAVYGQIAGAHYGATGIPEPWRQRLAMIDTISGLARKLHGEIRSSPNDYPPLVRDPSQRPMPGPDDIRAITAFLPVFESPEFIFGETRGGDRTADGTITMPYYTLGDEASHFYFMLHERGFIRMFKWNRWTREAKRYVDDPSALDQAGLDTICKLFTTHVRADRFNEGHLGSMFECGHITRLLQRLKQMNGEE